MDSRKILPIHQDFHSLVRRIWINGFKVDSDATVELRLSMTLTYWLVNSMALEKNHLLN
jgi:hypothetical protein